MEDFLFCQKSEDQDLSVKVSLQKTSYLFDEIRHVVFLTLDKTVKQKTVITKCNNFNVYCDALNALILFSSNMKQDL